MQKFLSKYALAAHLALLAVAPLFLFPFFGPCDTANVLLWMSLLSILWLFLEPSRRVDEYLYNARTRVSRSIKTDPLFWAFMLFLVLAFIRWMNSGVELVYDISGKDWRWIVNTPAVSWLPGSGSPSGYVSFAVLLAVIAVITACRHALGKSARVMFVFLTSLFAGVASLIAMLMVKSGSAAACSAAFCSYSSASFVGSAFGIFFIASLVALAGMFECKWNRALILFSFASGSTFAGLWFFAPPAVIALYCCSGALLLLISIVYVAATKGSVAFFKFLVALLLAASVPLLAYLFLAPEELIELKKPVLDFELFPEGFFETRRMYASMAADIWRNGNIWHGGGVGSLPLYIRLDFAEGMWTSWIPCGWWQFLAERGFIGLAIYILPFCFMIFTFIARLVASRGRRVFWPLAVFGFVATIAVMAEGFFNSSFMRPEVLLSVGAFFALGASSFPPARARDDAKKE